MYYTKGVVNSRKGLTMKCVIGIILAMCAAVCFVGCMPQEANNAQAEIDALRVQLDAATDANERLADAYIDLEADNKELREVNAALMADNQALANREPEIIYRTEYVEVPAQDEYIECGGCGAHVHDWYYIQNMAGTDVVAVCRDCYDASVMYYNGEAVEQTVIPVEG